VRVALWSVAMAAVVALKVADVVFAGTVTVAGTESRALPLEMLTGAPPLGAALVRVAVQVLEELEPRLVGLHANEDTSTGATSETAADRELVPYVAVTGAL
ncbi:MAG: hypothetical protein JST11_22630, partial [Acidobacteria bacterium]|nr:hypothetical protein [Acidobacteriota bacterium]